MMQRIRNFFAALTVLCVVAASAGLAHAVPYRP